MLVSFSIEYHTHWGEEVRVLGSAPELGGGDPCKAILLKTSDGIHWYVEKEVKLPVSRTIEYNYHIYREGKIIRSEWKAFARLVNLSGESNKEYKMYDSWRDLPVHQYFYASAFTESLLARRQRDRVIQSYRKGLAIKVMAPRIHEDYSIGICGNQELLGNWDPTQAHMMSDADFPEWHIELDAAKLTFPLEYKFVLYHKKEQRFEGWENHSNRCIEERDIKDYETHILSDKHVSFDLPMWKGSGVAIPVFSLKSESSYGVGDFGDLKKMIDWAVTTNQKVVQILPINDTTMTRSWTDSYPYNSISIYAFHPIYMDLSQLGKLKNNKKIAAFAKRQKELNSLSLLDYEAVNTLKWEYFNLIFEQEGVELLASDAFRSFFVKNKEWLQPYAAFSYLRDLNRTANFRDWPEYSQYDALEIDRLCQPGKAHYPQIAIYYYIQFHLHLQLLEATTYARAHGVVLKGDIPIGISRDSVEAWTEPHYFNLNGQAGAPPDDFSVNGQNWGFPTYNWEAMEKDGYKWWMKRFQKMSEYFDAYRIDHILGFFRIWEIPMNAVHGLLGQFAPALPMTLEEIESFGLPFQKERFLTPYIHESFLEQLFDSHVEYVKQTFIEPANNEGRYQMRLEFDNQRKVEAFFNTKTDVDSARIRDGLYALISDVLFVPDHNDPDKYHPRIGVQRDFIYQTLKDEEKSAFNELYNQYYYQRHNEFWHRNAMKKLPQLIQSTRMLVCGEDLGMIPESVGWVMNDLQILTLEIQRMPKEPYQEFAIPTHYPYCSVCTVSTHDMSTLRGWWEEDYQQTQRFYNNVLTYAGEAPKVATPAVCEGVLRAHLLGNSMLCIIAFQDWMSIDERWRSLNVEEERINVPANPRHYWRYRMHLTLEQLMKLNEFNNKIKEMITESGRALEK